GWASRLRDGKSSGARERARSAAYGFHISLRADVDAPLQVGRDALEQRRRHGAGGVALHDAVVRRADRRAGEDFCLAVVVEVGCPDAGADVEVQLIGEELIEHVRFGVRAFRGDVLAAVYFDVRVADRGPRDDFREAVAIGVADGYRGADVELEG